MTFREWLQELAYPASSLAAVLALITFILLTGVAIVAGPMGIWLAVVVVPAFFRYLTMIAEARARGAEAAPPGIEYFTLVGQVWTFAPTIFVLLAALATRSVGEHFGELPAIALALTFTAIIPAMIAVLVITHSIIESVNPVRVYRLIDAVGPSYWYAPATAALVVLVPTLPDALSAVLLVIVEMYLIIAFFAVCGAVTRSNKLIESVDIPEPLGPNPDEVLAAVEAQRMSVLNHAYGFVSRDNRTGGLGHIYGWLRKNDPDPAKGWSWFFENMLKWERNQAALFFAQQYVKRLLLDEQPVAALKLIMRCRMIDETFKPLDEDVPLAIEAARTFNNVELAAVLERL